MAAIPAIGLLVDWLEDEYQNETLAGVEDAARERGVSLVCYPGGVLDSPARFGKDRNFIYDLATRDCIDALVVVAGPIINHAGAQRLEDYLRPLAGMPICTISVPLPGVPSVLVDNTTGMREAVLSFVEQRRLDRVGFIRGPIANPEAELRYSVYRDVLRETGIPFDPDLVAVGDFRRRSGALAMRELLTRPGRPPQAVVAANDYMALGAMDELLDRGLRVPDDVALIGFDDLAESRFARVPLSTVRQPMRAAGRAALKLAVRLLNGEHVDAPEVLPTILVTRRSCGVRAGHRTATVHPPDVATLEQALIVTEPALAAQLRATTDQAAAVARAFVETVELGDPARFAEQLYGLADRATRAGGDVSIWQNVVSALRDHVAQILAAFPGAEARIETIWHLARMRLSELAERLRAEQVIRLTRHVQAMRRVGEAVLPALNIAEIMQVAADELANMDIEAAYVSLFDGDRMSEEATLVLSWEQGDAQPSSAPRRFPSRQLVPDLEKLRARRRSLVVEPIYFQTEQLGFAVFQMGPRDGLVYETLREQISSALKRGRLLKQLLDETVLRQRAEQEQLQKEVQIAVSIQTSILPRNPAVEGLEIAARMLPANEVGGDYYDVLPREGGCWIGIGDVAGHGLRTGLVMLMIQSTISGIVQLEPEAAPSAVVRAVNRALFDNVRQRLLQDEHATLTLLRYRRDGTLVFSGGHEDILVYRASEARVDVIPTPGPWVGAVRVLESGLVDTELQLGDGDVLVLFTDGVTEARGIGRQLFGVDRLAALLRSVGSEPVESVLERLLGAVLEWSPERDDDVTLFVARYRAPQATS